MHKKLNLQNHVKFHFWKRHLEDGTCGLSKQSEFSAGSKNAILDLLKVDLWMTWVMQQVNLFPKLCTVDFFSSSAACSFSIREAHLMHDFIFKIIAHFESNPTRTKSKRGMTFFWPMQGTLFRKQVKTWKDLPIFNTIIR